MEPRGDDRHPCVVDSRLRLQSAGLVEIDRLYYDEDLLVLNHVGGRFRRTRQNLASQAGSADG